MLSMQFYRIIRQCLAASKILDHFGWWVFWVFFFFCILLHFCELRSYSEYDHVALLAYKFARQ